MHGVKSLISNVGLFRETMLAPGIGTIVEKQTVWACRHTDRMETKDVVSAWINAHDSPEKMQCPTTARPAGPAHGSDWAHGVRKRTAAETGGSLLPW